MVAFVQKIVFAKKIHDNVVADTLSTLVDMVVFSSKYLPAISVTSCGICYAPHTQTPLVWLFGLYCFR